jgi:hypothetical protein
MSIVMSMYQKPQICADLTRGTSSINKNSSDRHLIASKKKDRQNISYELNHAYAATTKISGCRGRSSRI